MWFECEQPFLSGERCVTPRKTAAKETRGPEKECSLRLTLRFTVLSIQSRFDTSRFDTNGSRFENIIKVDSIYVESRFDSTQSSGP